MKSKVYDVYESKQLRNCGEIVQVCSGIMPKEPCLCLLRELCTRDQWYVYFSREQSHLCHHSNVQNYFAAIHLQQKSHAITTSLCWIGHELAFARVQNYLAVQMSRFSYLILILYITASAQQVHLGAQVLQAFRREKEYYGTWYWH